VAPKPDANLRAGRLFDPAGVFWQVNREMLMALSGARAVLLELAHPLVAEGVARHSGFGRNRFGRLYRTLRLMIACNFGTQRKVERELRRMAAKHRPVAGKLEHPCGAFDHNAKYGAADPHLRLWVWATLIDSTLRSYEALIRPLSAVERAAYYSDSRTLAELFDIPQSIVPTDYNAFEDYFNGMLASSEITVSETARDQARLLFAGALVGRAVRTASLLGISLLPARLRKEFDLEWNTANERRAQGLARVCKKVRSLLPDVLCVWPQATWGEWAVAMSGRSDHRLRDWKSRRSHP